MGFPSGASAFGDARDGEPLPVRVLPDPDRATDEAGRIGVGFERVVADEGGLVFIGAVIARAGGDGADAFDRGDEGKLPDAENSKCSSLYLILQAVPFWRWPVCC